MRTLGVATAAFLIAGCGSNQAPGKSSKGKAATDQAPLPAANDDIEELPWKGKRLEPDEDLCPEPHDTAFVATNPIFKRVEIRRGGIAVHELGLYRRGLAESASLRIEGCSHEVAIFEFKLKKSRGTEDEDIEVGLDLLTDLPLEGRGPIYAKAIREAFIKGERDPDAANLIYNDATIAFWHEPADDGSVIVRFRYDFAL